MVGHAWRALSVPLPTMTRAGLEHSQTVKETLRVSRPIELLRQARKADKQLGLVFEQDQLEAVELPGRAVRRGDKVRVLPPRGEVKQGDQAKAAKGLYEAGAESDY